MLAIVERVTRGERPVVFRPLIERHLEADDGIQNLMTLCWDETPAFRPNFMTIKNTLRQMSRGLYTIRQSVSKSVNQSISQPIIQSVNQSLFSYSQSFNPFNPAFRFKRHIGFQLYFESPPDYLLFMNAVSPEETIDFIPCSLSVQCSP